MNAFQLGKIVSAVALVATKVASSMSGSVRICPEMSGQNRQNDKTYPNEKSRNKGGRMLEQSGNPGAPGKDERASNHANRPLSPRQQTAVGLLLRGKSAAAVGRLLSISERTVRRWLHDAHFIAEVNASLAALKAPARKPVPMLQRNSPYERR